MICIFVTILIAGLSPQLGPGVEVYVKPGSTLMVSVGLGNVTIYSIFHGIQKYAFISIEHCIVNMKCYSENAAVFFVVFDT